MRKNRRFRLITIVRYSNLTNVPEQELVASALPACRSKKEMPPIFKQRPHVVRVRPEIPETLGLSRPSGDPFARPGPNVDVTGTLNTIDTVLAQNEEEAISALPVEPSAENFGAPTVNPRHEQIFNDVLRNVRQDTGGPTGRSAEDGADDEWVDTQEYSHSTRVIELVGSLAVRGALNTPEGKIAKETLRERFESSVIEMLHTDEEFRSKLEINRERKHVVRNGVVMALDGKTSMTGITYRGKRSAMKAAEAEEAMEPVAARCAADERVAKRVEELPVGGFMMGLSIDPKEAMARYGKEFYGEKGFREGLAFLQWYYRIDENTLLAATYSVDHSDIQIWREVLAEFGIMIPQDERTDTWLDHDITQQCSLEEGRQFVRKVRGRFYQKRGASPPLYSVDEFMAINQTVCDEMFESLYMNLAAAQETKQLDPALQTFVHGLLASSKDLNQDIRNQLYKVRANAMVEQADIALLEQLIRYAVTEQLRTGLRYLGTKEPPLVQNFVTPVGMSQAAFIAQSAATNVLTGARAGRTYGGCTKSINPGSKDNNPFFDRPQDAFGGLDLGDELPEDDDGLGPRIFRCKKGHLNTRPRGELLKECQTAGCEKGSVGCEVKLPEPPKKEKKIEEIFKPLALEGLAALVAGSKNPKKSQPALAKA